MHDLVEVVEPGDARVLSWDLSRAVQLVGQHFVEDVVDEARLAGAADTGHSDEGSEGKTHRDVAQIVCLRSDHGDLAFGIDWSAFLRRLDHAAPGEVIAGDRVLVFQKRLVRARVHNHAAVFTGAGADVDDPVGGANRIFVVFDHDQCVAQALQLDQRFDKPTVVTLVQTDGWLIEHVEHTGQPRPDLRRQADSLCLPAAERRCRAGQVEVGETYLNEKLEPEANLAQHLSGDFRVTLAEGQGGHESVGVAERQLAHIRNASRVDGHGEHFWFEPLTVADRAVNLTKVTREPLALHVGLGLEVLTLDVGDDALEAGRVGHVATEAVAPLHRDFKIIAVENRLLCLAIELAPGSVEAEVKIVGEAAEQPLEVVEQPLARLRPRQNRAVGDAHGMVGDEQVGIHRHFGAQA